MTKNSDKSVPSGTLHKPWRGPKPWDKGYKPGLNPEYEAAIAKGICYEKDYTKSPSERI